MIEKIILRLYDDEAFYAEFVARAYRVGQTQHNLQTSTQRLIEAISPFMALRAGDRDSMGLVTNSLRVQGSSTKTVKSICVNTFLGGPRSMGKVGHYFLSHLLSRNRYRVYFLPFETDYLAGKWEERFAKLVIKNPEAVSIDQQISFCSVLDAKQKRFAPLLTPWMFYELSTLPKQIAADINTNDQIYVDSSFVQKTFANHGVTVPISIMGHGFDPTYYQFTPRIRDGKFIFLCVAENTPRKNLPTLVRCFEKAFQNNDDVRLVLKLGLHGIGALRQHITQPEKITLFSKPLNNDAEMVMLYKHAHCFVLPTRSEGFGMPILEAMATGLPVIVTDYSGHLDFCDRHNSFLINNRGLVDADPAVFPYVMSQWGDPDEDHLIYLMRQVFSNYEMALEVGRKGFETVSVDWTWESQLGHVF